MVHFGVGRRGVYKFKDIFNIVFYYELEDRQGSGEKYETKITYPCLFNLRLINFLIKAPHHLLGPTLDTHHIFCCIIKCKDLCITLIMHRTRPCMLSLADI
jgi:hypothetical protein